MSNSTTQPNMNYVLLTYSFFPESIKQYLIPEAFYQQHSEAFAEAQNKIVNYEDMNPGMEFLKYGTLEEQDPYDDTPEKYRGELWGCLVQYEVSSDKPVIMEEGSAIVAAFFSGFGL